MYPLVILFSIFRKIVKRKPYVTCAPLISQVSDITSSKTHSGKIIICMSGQQLVREQKMFVDDINKLQHQDKVKEIMIVTPVVFNQHSMPIMLEAEKKLTSALASIEKVVVVSTASLQNLFKESFVNGRWTNLPLLEFPLFTTYGLELSFKEGKPQHWRHKKQLTTTRVQNLKRSKKQKSRSPTLLLKAVTPHKLNNNVENPRFTGDTESANMKNNDTDSLTFQKMLED